MLRILEVSWLVIALLSLAMGTYKFLTSGFDEAIYIYLIALVATAFYFVRRKQRMSFQKQDSSKNAAS